MRSEFATTLVVFATIATSIWAFNNRSLHDRWLFKPKEVLADKEYWRLISSGFIHADWMHLGFNLFSFASFGSAIELMHGPRTLLAVYFASILGGSLLALLIHRHHDYAALGASGGVCGVIYACIFLIPGSGVSMFLLPISIPAWLYAVGYLAVSFLAMRRGHDNIGHDAHIGGAIIGLLTATVLHPWIVSESPGTYAAVMALSTLILAVTWIDPLHLLDRRFSFEPKPNGHERYQRYDEAAERNRRVQDMDRLLDKVSANGLQSLSKSERERLEKLSKELR